MEEAQDDEMDPKRKKMDDEYPKVKTDASGKVSLEQIVKQVFEHIDDLREEFKEIRLPPGTKESPARTCKDIYLAYPESKDGWYWIDPNLGVALDAIQVWCNMTAEGETCISPKRNTRVMIPRHFPKDDSVEWFSDMHNGYKIKYPSESQMTFLRLLSIKASQKLTYFCTNAVAWFNQEENNYEKSIKLLGANDHTIQKFKNKEVIYDGCRNRRSNAYTVFVLKTRKVNQLPIVDLMPRDYGAAWQKFGFEVGPVCFSH